MPATVEQKCTSISINRAVTTVAPTRFTVMRYQRNGNDVKAFDGSMVNLLKYLGQDVTGKDFIYHGTANSSATPSGKC